MSAQALSDQVEYLRKLLRRAVETHEGTLPSAVLVWWEEEQRRISAEEAAKAAKQQQRRIDLAAKIAALQAELDAL